MHAIAPYTQLAKARPTMSCFHLVYLESDGMYTYMYYILAVAVLLAVLVALNDHASINFKMLVVSSLANNIPAGLVE